MQDTTATLTTPEFSYPLFLRMAGTPVVVVGGGSVACRKALHLASLGAQVKIVSPEIDERLRLECNQGAIEWVDRPYREGDLEGALLTVCATDDRAVNEAVHAEAQSRGQLVNVVDVPELCNAIVPSVMRRGRLQVAVSTDGASPSIAREVRCQLEGEFPAWWEDYLDAMAELRSLVKQRVPGSVQQRLEIYRAIQESDLRERVSQGEQIDVEMAYERIVSPLLEGGVR